MRNGGRSIKTIGGASRRGASSRKQRVGVVRAFLAALLLAAAALSGVAVLLTTRMGSGRTAGPAANTGIGSSLDGFGGGRVTMSSKAEDAMPQSAAKPSAGQAEPSPPETTGSRGASSASKVRPADDNAAAKEAYALSQKRAPYPNGPKADPKYARDRVYCMVPFVWNPEMYTVIMQTWGKRCNVIHFLTDAEVLVGGKMQGDVITGGGYKHHTVLPDGTFPDNVVFIEMSRQFMGCVDSKTNETKVCRHIWEKMWRSWVYVSEHHLDDAEWFCKVDYDTFFFPENLQYFVRDYKGWNPVDEHHYFGHVLYQHDDRPPFAVGAAACFSRKTLKGIAGVYRDMPKGHKGRDRKRCEDRAEASEELGTSMCLKKGLNVTATPMIDYENREYVTVDPVHNVLTWNRTEQGEWWYWKNKPKDRGQLDDCCSVRPMGFHKYKRRDQIAQLDELFYGPANNKAIEDVVKLVRKDADKVRVRKYFGKVRKAMGIDP